MIKKVEIIEYLQNKKDTFFDNYNINNIALYGSYAKDKQNDNSDIDILISSKSPKNIDKLKKELENQFHKKIDILNENDIFLETIKQMIKKESIYV
jgi:predicted nucleotidyltransferase